MTDSVQNTDFPGGSKKLRKGNVGGEPEQPMLFAFLIGQASHIITQGTEKMEILPKEILSKEAVPGSLKSGSLNPGIESGSLKSGLKNPGIESGSLKSGLTSAVVGNDAAVKKNSRVIPKEGSGKNSIENLLKNPGLKGKEIIVEHGKTGVKELTGHKMEILPKEILSPKHLVDKIPSMGGYHHTAIHAGSSTAAVNESVNNYSMEPRNLINQIANSLTRPGRVRIALTPPHLGTLDMDVLVRNNKVHIILQTENNDVRHMLQSNVDTLKTALRSQGLIADNITVIIQERSDSAGYSGFGRNETQFKENNNQKENEEDHRGRSDSLNYTPSPFDKENPRVMIDGGISLFV